MLQKDSSFPEKYRSLLLIIGLFLFFLIFKMLDIFWLTLDEEWGDILLSKSFSVVLILFLLIFMGKTLADIGIKREYFFYNIFFSLGFVLLSIISTRLVYTFIAGDFLAWDFSEVTLTFLYFTFVTNIVNVMMEESLFRGIFLRLSLDVTKKHFWKANLIQAFFFGLWHFPTPLKGYISGEVAFFEFILFTIVLCTFSFLVAVPWGYYYYKTSSLLPSLIWHLFWNATLGISPLLSDNMAAYLPALLVGTLIGLGSIPLFERIISPKVLDELPPWI
ncbi:MAG: CPBP family intramembrane glutamic endopeptidase [Candidatus Hodarchaeales archaeon]